MDQLLLEALFKNNMTMKDVNYIPMPITEAYNAMFAGKVDATVLSTLKMLEAKKRGARVLTTAKGLMLPKLVVAVNESFAKNHPDWIARYIKVQDEAMEFIKSHKHKALQLAAEDHEISYQDAEWLYNNTNFINTLSTDEINSVKNDIDFLLSLKK
ncbi:MAG: ABC transporter substrate-binding protein [Lentisphaerae bacterium]|nr:ABC transporter substrate-binding protein [Lentisphaerota bacterium]MCP4100517.1 ABC transporter substrate-binding protein [Lentisphaerota bacterium]